MPVPVLSFDGRFEYSNATVRWTVACRQLDGGNSLLDAHRASRQRISPLGPSPYGIMDTWFHRDFFFMIEIRICL